MKIVTGTLRQAENETFRLSPAEKLQLRESIAQADRSEFVDAEQLLAELDQLN
jgi:hypothetical protein